MTTTVARLERLDPPDARSLRHLPGLDGVRGVAVLFVIGLHYGSLWDRYRPGGLLPGGYLGVDIFFVLSGFLITSLLVGEQAKTGRVDLAKFYARRALRLLPALGLILIAHFCFALWLERSLTSEAQQILSVVFYVSNFAQIYWLPEMLKSGLAFTWSLAIEEQFYLLWPALLLVGVLRFARTRGAVLAVIGAGALASAVTRFVVWNHGAHYPAAYVRPDCRADGLLVGAFCAFVWRWGLVPRRLLNGAALLCAAGLVATGVFLRAGDATFDYGFALVSLAAGVIVLAVAEGRTGLLPLMEWRPLRFVGRVSYALYLWHVLGLRIAKHGFPHAGRMQLALIGLSIMTAGVAVSWNLVEQPFLRLKRKVASPVPH